MYGLLLIMRHPSDLCEGTRLLRVKVGPIARESRGYTHGACMQNTWHARTRTLYSDHHAKDRIQLDQVEEQCGLVDLGLWEVAAWPEQTWTQLLHSCLWGHEGKLSEPAWLASQSQSLQEDLAPDLDFALADCLVDPLLDCVFVVHCSLRT